MPPTLIRDASRRNGISAEGAYNAYELPDHGPTGDVWIRNRLVDGQTGAGAAMPSERNDGQMGGVPLNVDRVVVWYERFTEMPTTSQDRWQVIGPEIHGPNISAFPQAILMMEVGPNKHRRLNSNAGRSSVRYFDIGPVELGRTYTMEMHVRLSASTTGYIRIWRDGVLVVDYHGVTIHTEVGGSYWKEANYRNAVINGPMTHEFSSLRIYDGDVEFGGGHTPPPPPSTDTTPPRVSLSVDALGAWTVDLPDLADTVSVLVGIAGDPLPSKLITSGLAPILTGQFDKAKLTPGETYWAWATAKDAAGNIGSSEGKAFTVPPLPPPTDPCADVKATLAAREATLTERTAAIVLAREDLTYIGKQARSSAGDLAKRRHLINERALLGLEHLED